jgi:hypothetical protein
MLLFRNEYPPKKSNLWSESLLDDAAGAAFGANDGTKCRFVVTLAGAGVLFGAGSETTDAVVPADVCAPAGTTDTAKKAANASGVITPSFFIFLSSP